jgi:hypothetical protein
MKNKLTNQTRCMKLLLKNIGVLEYWSVGLSTHYSITPPFHYSSL